MGDDLLAAYRRAIYRLHLPERDLDLRVGERSPELDRELDARAAREWAWLTAANPGSARLSEAENARRLARLHADLGRLGLPVLAGTGLDPEGGWPAEPSFLVVGLARAVARELGRRHGQRAVLAGERGGAPELVEVGGGERGPADP